MKSALGAVAAQEASTAANDSGVVDLVHHEKTSPGQTWG
jgi:hypothetical protein